jgi:predicted lipoprotein with Yx(FWY)xxD motif
MMTMVIRSVRPVGVLSVAAVMVLSACGKSTTPNAGGTSTPPTQAASVTVSTASISGAGTVLVDGQGFPLYTLKTEASGTIMCTGSCATAWPPLLLPAGVTAATAGSGVEASKLGTIKRPDGGTQVTYKGLPLYLFASDQSGQATGDGVAGFSVASVSGADDGGSSSGGGGY